VAAPDKYRLRKRASLAPRPCNNVLGSPSHRRGPWSLRGDTCDGAIFLRDCWPPRRRARCGQRSQIGFIGWQFALRPEWLVFQSPYGRGFLIACASAERLSVSEIGSLSSLFPQANRPHVVNLAVAVKTQPSMVTVRSPWREGANGSARARVCCGEANARFETENLLFRRKPCRLLNTTS
jgi:hypothetical protein